jgi:hypothetical protein
VVITLCHSHGRKWINRKDARCIIRSVKWLSGNVCSLTILSPFSLSFFILCLLGFYFCFADQFCLVMDCWLNLCWRIVK